MGHPVFWHPTLKRTFHMTRTFCTTTTNLFNSQVRKDNNVTAKILKHPPPPPPPHQILGQIYGGTVNKSTLYMALEGSGLLYAKVNFKQDKFSILTKSIQCSLRFSCVKQTFCFPVVLPHHTLGKALAFNSVHCRDFVRMIIC